jgi:GAF domain-containing protein
MKRRSSAGSKRPTPKRRKAPKATRHRGASIAGQQTVVARLTHERDEALLRESANSEILRLISKSSGDLELVFRAILEHATRICNANFGTLFRFDGENLYPAAQFKTPTAYLEAQMRRGPFQPTRGTVIDRVMRTKQVIHSVDRAAEPIRGLASKFGGARSLVAVPMLKDDRLLGIIVIYRQEVRPFTEKQIELVQNFAAQSVIAIEDARLLNELRERTADLTASLERQTATADVLRIISSSPGELKSVFETILENAARLCQANFSTLYLAEGNAYRTTATYNVPVAFAESRHREPMVSMSGNTALARVAKMKSAVQISDVASDPAYREDPQRQRFVTLTGARSLITVPMLKDDVLIGAINVYRLEVRPFADKQIELLKNFAAQAVIAIENARLLGELRESLEQQTATSDVLRIISSSRGELEPVFQAMLENATRICEASFGNMFLYDGGKFQMVARHNPPSAYDQWVRGGLWSRQERAHPNTPLTRIARDRSIIHIADLSQELSYVEGNSRIVALVDLAGARTFLGVPILNEDGLVGAITIYRQEIRPFSEKQIAVVQNFAAQAVIAVENTRLLKELHDRTEQLEAQSQEVVKLNRQLEQRVSDQVGEIERMSRLRRFLPPQVADLIVASGMEKQLESHRREITALFCDLRGFTGFSESSDPEDVMALLRDYHAAIGQIIIKYSGTLERYAGDGVMVVFNDPVPVENPPLQAVLMALEMRDAIGALTETWHRWGHDIGFGIGIAHGFATLGTIGFEGRFDYAAIGTVSNVASRLCDEARPGQILISPRVLTKVENAVTVEAVGEFTLKGIRRPMTAYNVLAASPSKPD